MAGRSSGVDDTVPASDSAELGETVLASDSAELGATVPASESAELGATVPAGPSTEPLSDSYRSPAAAASPTSAPPPADARYRLGAELGRGGMGRVVEAFDTHLGRTVALKEVLPQGTASIAKRFQREVRITARLEHASIVPLYDSGAMADGRPFYVMRRVSGRPLDELIARARGLDERLALLPNVLAAIDAIAHAHRRGVIHRDIKPQNILVGELGETVVIDWGLAKVIGESEPPPDSIDNHVPTAADSLQTQVGSVFGTPGFMAPEQARGDELDPRTDVFALGATLYQLIAGKPPVAGKSATEVIASTLVNKIPPVTKLAPSAPAELATIIAKALAYAADQRYADAGALAEDVRAFLTGRLVAAHRYTRRQRIARFAKRHRAALSVAALAATAVAVLSWVSVHRILKERDAATAARHEAEAQRLVADSKAEEARQRADQLLLAHARSLLDTSPTQAIAVLAHVESTSPQTLDGARAIAKAAVARGVAWGVRSLPGMTTSFEMTRDGKRLLQVNRFGKLQVVDLERRKQVAATDIGVGSSATWVDGGRMILVDRDKQIPALYDPATNAFDGFGTAPIRDWDKTPTGELVAYLDDRGNVGVIDVAKRTQTPLWTKGSAERSLAIATDGSWLAFGDRGSGKPGRLVVIDRTGKQLLERPGSAVVLGASPGGKLAVSFFDRVVELKPGEPAAPVTAIPLGPNEAQLTHQLVYRDEILYLLGGRNVVGWSNGRIFRSDVVADTVYFAQPAADRMLVVSANDSNVHLLRDGAHLILPITEAPEGMYRVAASRDTNRVAATAKDVILIWDAAPLFPHVVDTAPGMFITNRRVVVPEGPLSTWSIWDLDSDARTPIKATIDGIPMDYQAQTDEGRMLVLVQSPQGTSALVIYPDGHTDLAVPELGKGEARIVRGNAIIYSLGKNRIFGKLGAEPSRELVTVDGDLQSLAANGKLGYAALSTTGEVVKGTFSGADFARTKLTDLDKHAFVVSDVAGHVLIGSGNRLLRWQGDVREVARFAVPIDYISSTEIGLYVSLTNHDLYFVPAAGNLTPLRVPITQLSSISESGRVLVGMTPSSQIEVVDMPSLAPWTLPKLYTGFPRVAVSPDGMRLEQSLGAGAAIWRVAEPGSDLQAWLAELTNATDADGHVHWPWQP